MTRGRADDAGAQPVYAAEYSRQRAVERARSINFPYPG